MKHIIGIIASFTASAASVRAQRVSSANTPANYTLVLEQHPCQSFYSEDLYGLGTRIGYYFNWMSGWIANNYVLDEIDGAQDTNSIFLLGVLASLLRGTRTRVLKRIDGIILLQMAAGTSWSVLSLWGYRTCVYRHEKAHGIAFFGGFGTHFRLLLSVLLAVYATWFFAVGVKADSSHALKISDNPHYCNRIHVIGMSLSGGARNLGIVLSSGSLIYCTVLIIASSLAGFTRLWKIVWLLSHNEYASSSRLRYISGLGPKHLKLLSLVFRVFNFLWIIFIIATIETTIRENNIRAVRFNNDADILTPAQLLPLIIGLSSFGRMSYYAYEYFRSDQGDINPSLGVDKSIFSSKHDKKPTPIVQRVKWIFKLLSPTFRNSLPSNKDIKSEALSVLEVREEWSGWQKTINTVLPWMSLLSFWPWNQSPRAKKIEGFRDVADQETGEEAAKSVSSANSLLVQRRSK